MEISKASEEKFKLLSSKAEDSAAYARYRLNLPLREYVLETLRGYRDRALVDKNFAEFSSQGGGASWNDIIKAVEDGSELGRMYVEQFRQVTEAEMKARGIKGAAFLKQLEKPKFKIK